MQPALPGILAHVAGGRGSDGRLVADPISELFDAGAVRLLRRAYAARPNWAGTPVAAPTLEHRAWALSMGIDLDEQQAIGDNPPLNRWLRGFVRRCYWYHKWFYYEQLGTLDLSRRRMAPADTRSLRYEVGWRARRIPGTAFFGTPVRLRLMAGHQLGKVPPERRYTENDSVRSTPEDRDW